MTGEIISVGTELLMGMIVNTDAQYLANELNKYGFNLYHQSTVGDNMNRLVEAIETAMDRCDLLILSGGLGPTEDDLTKEAVAKYLGLPMVQDEQAVKDLNAYMAQRGKTITPNNYRQAEFPAGAHILRNSCGTAPGCVCETGGKLIAVLPGPPHELKAMFESGLAPLLEERMDSKFCSRYIRVVGMGESAVEYEIKDIIDAQTNPTIAPYASVGEMCLRVTAAVGKDEDPDALVEPVVQKICERLGDYVYSTHGVTLPRVVEDLLKQQQKTISVAESLSGGQICSDLVEIPGTSEVLLEGAVLYTDEAKIRLGVSQETIERFSAVSEQTAREMAEAMRRRSGSSIAVATTGVAGPGPDAGGHPQGLFYVGVADEQGSVACEFRARGSRVRVRSTAVLYALDCVRRRLLGKL